MNAAIDYLLRELVEWARAIGNLLQVVGVIALLALSFVVGFFFIGMWALIPTGVLCLIGLQNLEDELRR